MQYSIMCAKKIKNEAYNQENLVIKMSRYIVKEQNINFKLHYLEYVVEHNVSKETKYKLAYNQQNIVVKF